MLGFRGASRYIASSFRECFRLECEAMKYVRDVMGLTNVELMVPFVRTLKEADAVLEIMKAFGLERGANGLRIVMMCEIPSNALLADEFLERFDGFSIGSNDMTQMTLALDREFANGWRIGAFATLTDVSFNDFGEGSFDKGIRIRIPFAWAIGQPTQKNAGMVVRPILRDGGARLNVDGRLYDFVRDYHSDRLDDQWGRFWR